MNGVIWTVLICSVIIVFILKLAFQRADNVNEASYYSIFITDSFEDEDKELLRPIFTLVYLLDDVKQEAILCRVIKGEGEVTLEQAEEMMKENIEYALKHSTYIDSFDFEEECIESYEKDAIKRLRLIIKV